MTASGGGAPLRLSFPRALEPGDLIAVVAPASPFEAALGWRGLGFLAQRYRVRFDRGLFSRSGYLAGSDARRGAELAQHLADPNVRAIVCARGGYGASRIVDDLPWDAFAQHPKWLVGFSDITVLHVEANRLGIASLHAPHLTALGRSDTHGRAAWLRALEAPGRRQRHTLEPLRPGAARGPIVGGNLTLLHAAAAAGRLKLPRGALLFVEDVTERPYRIDRMLTGLLSGGHLAGIAGVVLGDFTDCPPGPDRTTVESVLLERLSLLDVPMAAGLPCGHGTRNDPLVLGAQAELDVGAGSAELIVGDDSTHG